MTEAMPVVFDDNWEVYSYRIESGPMYVSFYAGAMELPRDRYPFCARVLLPIREPNDNGGPTGAEAEQLWAYEDQLTEALTAAHVPCVLVARLTHAGQRELVFQLADWESFRPTVGRWLQALDDDEIDVSEHEGWEFFDDCVWPSATDWLLIQDRRVVDALIEAGSDPAREHALDFVFRGEPGSLQQLRKGLEARGYVPHPDENEDPEQLVMVKRLPLDLDQIFDESLANAELCEELDLEFDGWGAAVVKQI